MLCKVTQCTGCVLVNTRPHQLRWGDREMGTAIPCIKCSQVAGFIQKIGRSASEALSLSTAVLRTAIFRSKIVAFVIVACLLMCVQT